MTPASGNRLSRRRFLAATAGLLATPRFAAAQNPRWTVCAPLPVQTQELYPAVHDSRLWVAGGIARRLGIPFFTNGVWSYGADLDSWRTEATLPEPRHHAAMVSTGARLYVVGGFGGTIDNPWKMLDSVVVLNDGAWEPLGTMPQRQAEGVLAHRQDGIVHLATGQTPKGTANRTRSHHSETPEHWIWDTHDDRWESAAPIPTARNSATGGWIGDELIVTGGRTSAGNLDHTEIYDYREDRWRSAAPMPLPQAGTASVVLDDSLIVFGGEVFFPEARVFSNVWRYFRADDRWEPLPDLPTPRHGEGAGLIGRTAYVIGGATAPGGNGTTDVNEALTFP